MKKSRIMCILFVIASMKCIYSQHIGTDIFLQGNFIEIGQRRSGAFGSEGNAPAGYHPLGAFRLGFVADPDLDGWTVGTPVHFGDYFLPGTPQEGWDIMVNGAWNRAWTSSALFSSGLGPLSLIGNNISYTSSGTARTAHWQGTMVGTLQIEQKTELDINNTFFVVEVTLTNTGGSILENIFYGRTVDPDNEVTHTGSYVTANKIEFVPDGIDNRALVSARGLNWPTRSYVGLGTIDCRAKPYIYRAFIRPEHNPSVIVSGMHPNYMMNEGDTLTSDRAIGLVFSIGDLMPGQTTMIRYAYILREADLMTAFSALEPQWMIDGTIHADNSIIVGCPGELITVSIINGEGLTWGTWTPETGLSPSSGHSVNVTVPEDTVTYTVIGSNPTCANDTMTITIIPAPPHDTIVTTEMICEGDSVSFHDSFYGTSGIYHVIYPDIFGCDSVIQLNLIVNPLINSILDTVICSGQSIVFNGITYTGTTPASAGIRDTFTSSASGCDSIVTLNLVVNDTIRTEHTEILCHGGIYTWAEISYTTPGTYLLDGSNSEGCDTLHTITLIVNPIDTVPVSVSICTGTVYDFFGTELSTPGVYYNTTSGLCDTTWALILSINDTIREYAAISICSGGSIAIGATILNSEGIYPLYFSTTDGCDSLYILTVTVDPASHDTTMVSICEGDIYHFYGTDYTSEGIYNHTDVTGSCDTLRVLIIDIRPVYNEVSGLIVCNNDLPISYLGVTIPYGASSDPSYTSVTYTSIDGCDSVITIDLTVLDSSRTNIDTILCYGAIYEFGGTSITSPGIYFNSLTNSSGCDSVLALTVSYTAEPVGETINLSGCEQVEYNGSIYTEDTFFTDTLRSTLGCDSIYKTMNISILDVPFDTIYVEICQGENYNFNGKILSEAVTLTDTFMHYNGCDSLITLKLSIHPLPDIELTFEGADDLICIFDTVMLEAAGTLLYTFYDNFYDYIGEGGNIHVRIGQNNSTYYVVGTDENGCKDTAYVTIWADNCCDMLIPNAFSPNGDGLNDNFGSVTDGHPLEYHMVVYNRWGQKVFTGFNASDKWDGTDGNGRPCDPGTYYYVITGKCYDGTPFRLTGDITLIR